MMEQPADTFVKVARYPQYSFDFKNNLVMNDYSKRVHGIGEVLCTSENGTKHYYSVSKLLVSAKNDIPYKEVLNGPTQKIKEGIANGESNDWVSSNQYYGLLINLKTNQVKKVFSNRIYGLNDRTVNVRMGKVHTGLSIGKILYSIKYNIPYAETPPILTIKSRLNIGAVDTTGLIKKDEYPGLAFDLDKEWIVRITTGRIYKNGIDKSISITIKKGQTRRQIARIFYSLKNRIPYNSISEFFITENSKKLLSREDFIKTYTEKAKKIEEDKLKAVFAERIQNEIDYLNKLQKAESTGNWVEIMTIIYSQIDYATNLLKGRYNLKKETAAQCVNDALVPTIQSIMGGRFLGFPNNFLYKYAMGIYLQERQTKKYQFNDERNSGSDDNYDHNQDDEYKY